MFAEYKIYFIKKYFSAAKTEDLIKLLDALKKSIINNSEIDESPFLYCLNPIKNGLLIIELVTLIRNKFKSMQVKSMEIQKFVEESILRYVNYIED